MSSDDTSTKLAKLMQTLTENTIDTPIDVLKERVATESREEIIKKLNAMYTEMVKLQYRLREYATVEWYDTLDDRRKSLHGVFEQNREFFKKGSGEKNWLFLSELKPEKIEVERMDSGDQVYYFAYMIDTASMEADLASMRTRELNKCLCVPLFKAQ
jgi:hypothetical protein